MSRIVTSSEVDRLHQQVAELQKQVAELRAQLNGDPEFSSGKDELFELTGEQDTRSDADIVIEALAVASTTASTT